MTWREASGEFFQLVLNVFAATYITYLVAMELEDYIALRPDPATCKRHMIITVTVAMVFYLIGNKAGRKQALEARDGNGGPS